MTDAPITIGTTATPIFAGVQDVRSRKWYSLRWPKEATETLYIGGRNVTTANGQPIYPGEWFGDANRFVGGYPAIEELYGVVGSSEAETLRVREGK